MNGDKVLNCSHDKIDLLLLFNIPFKNVSKPHTLEDKWGPA